ncbi:MAG: Maf family protein [Candidatus Chromulinivorax sp.]
MQKNLVYLASNSASRKNLLAAARIPFQIIFQDADESGVDITKSLSEIVMDLALLKMQHAQLPQAVYEGQIIFVLTADTLGKIDAIDRILTKPKDRQDAVTMLEQARLGSLTCTGFCLRKLQWQNNAWQILDEIIDYDQATSIFDVPDYYINFYLDSIDFLSVSGAISIEGIGGQFLKTVQGNYEAIVGLPMFKVRQALYFMNFYS